jgi:hypothetical protein
MRIKIIIILLLLLVLFILLIGCIDDNAESSDLENLVGTWTYTGDIYVSKITFYENLSLYSNSTIISNQEVHEDWGEFWFDQSKLCMYTHMGYSGEEESTCYSYYFSENNTKLTLTAPGLTNSVLIKLS